MRKALKGFFLLSLLSLVPATAAFSQVFPGNGYISGNPHINRGKGQCSVCHTSTLPQLIDDHVETCTNCHIGNIENHPVTRHPIDVAVKINIPTPLPLTEEDRIVCSTCHDPHDDQGFTSMLRVHYHKLCIQCHRGY